MVADAEAGTLTTSDEKARSWRISCFQEMGFTSKESEALADVKEPHTAERKGKKYTYEWPLHHVKVRKMIEAGAKPIQVLRIFGVK